MLENWVPWKFSTASLRSNFLGRTQKQLPDCVHQSELSSLACSRIWKSFPGKVDTSLLASHSIEALISMFGLMFRLVAGMVFGRALLTKLRMAGLDAIWIMKLLTTSSLTHLLCQYFIFDTKSDLWLELDRNELTGRYALWYSYSFDPCARPSCYFVLRNTITLRSQAYYFTLLR